MNPLRRFATGVGVLLLFAFWGMVGHPVSCQAEELHNVSASTVKPTKVKVTFHMLSKEIDQIRLFRKEYAGKWEKIATLKGSAKSYKDTVKFNHKYGYKVVAYQKRGKKYNKFGSQTCSVHTYVAPVWWSGFADEQYNHPVTTPESICIMAELDPYSEGALKPNGYEIYRSEDNGHFECIKTFHTITNLKYVDTDVRRGQTYYYKIRGFYKYNKKKYYSSFSHTEMCMAANSHGTYSVKVLAGKGNTLSSVDVCLASAEGNAELTIQNTGKSGEARYLGWFSNGLSSVYPYPNVLITQYSINGTDWFPIEENSIVLKPGQAIYLRFERADGMIFDLTGEKAWIYNIPISCYPDYSMLSIDLIQQEVQITAEYD